ncbi:M1 family metallopeptidase [Dyella mobilis]|uniref:Aminopeptidase n=1 Tax=Dyella mobilis TaxID=1849582 RepID=A0ABS2KKK0_9GAMM|nr:M1 family metallopeptidase [Dyella mobilis]MBM7131681.1 M1 family metallopeptidase [Dyella mobilis]GLQ96343.1 aminopeptidase [Dyella mobilis]
MRRLLFSAIAVALAGVAFTQPVLAQSAMPAEVIGTTQLPRSVRPSHYDVSVTPHVDKLSFDGKVKVTLDVLKPTASITLNAIDLTFSSVSLSPLSGKASFGTPKVSVDANAQTATFTFAKPLPVGSYELSMDYTGKIDTQANGLFVIDYDTKAGKKHALYTQFENSDARRFIPSWDEPAYKATFTLTVTVPTGQMAVNNMPVAQKTDLGNGLTRVQFQQSPKMSTYLLFFGAGDFDRVTTSSDGTEIGVITQKGLTSQAGFALDSAKAVLHEYNDYFGTPYPLPKLDNIASPGSSQFFSAMENWGAIFTFEYAMLLDPSISTQADKEQVFGDEAHEMAHQWFGDLVTMRWWDDLWLNEGFASWMATRTTEKLHPEWHAELDTVDIRESAMGLDAVSTSHPIIQHVETVEQASQAFDAITYSKGESVIRMLEQYVGPDTWRDGVRRYIKDHAYGNTVSDDLWKAMETVTNKPVTTVAHDFTLQPGVPLIRVASETCKDGNTTLQLTQGQFSKGASNRMMRHWHVPVIAQTVGGKAVSTLVNGEASLVVPGCGPVVVNAGQSGYYRTQYSPQAFAALSSDYAKLAPIDQLGLLDDTSALGLAGLEPASSMLDLVKAAPNDASPVLWENIAGVLASLDSYYRDGEPGQAAFRAFAIAKLEPVFKQVGWETKPGEQAPVAILRNELIGTLAGLGDQSVIDEARRRYAAQATDPSAVPGPLRKVITEVVAYQADAATWDKLHAQAQAEKTPLVKDALYAMLASTKDEALAKRALDLALTSEPGATNSADMIGVVAHKHAELAFDFAVAHRAQVDKLLDPGSLSRFYPRLAYRSLDPAMIGKLQAFAQAHIAATSRHDADTVIANLQYRIGVHKDRMPQIDAWVKKNG